MQLRPAREISLKPEARRSPARRVLLLTVPLVLAVLLGGYVAWWLNVASDLRDRTLAWVDAQGADGWSMTYAAATRWGFPFRIGVSFDRPAVRSPSGDWSWNAERVRLAAPVFDREGLRLSLDGQQTIALPVNREQRRYAGRADLFAFDLTPGGWVPNGRLRIRNLDFSGPEAGEMVRLEALDLTSTGDPAAAGGPEVSTYVLEMTADGLRLPERAATPLGAEFERLALTAKLFGPLRFTPWPQALARWRDEGGFVEVPRLFIVAGPIEVQGDGTFALDKRGHPLAAMTARIERYELALDQLAARDVIPAHTAATGKILLRALARSDAPGESVLTAPLSLQDRTLSIGPVPLLRISEVHWLDGLSSGR